MRAALGTIQHTLTPKAASVLSHSIAEATHRNHGLTMFGEVVVIDEEGGLRQERGEGAAATATCWATLLQPIPHRDGLDSANSWTDLSSSLSLKL